METSPEPKPPSQATFANRFLKIPSLPPLPGLILTVFLDLLAFGLFIPDLQLRGKELGLTSIKLGLLFSAYSAAQILFAPWLGALSDRKGRRTVLIASSVLSLSSYLIYAHIGHSVLLMTISRILLGIAASNLGVAFAYASDISSSENRAKSVGSLGAAVGVGFIVGPPLGAWLIGIGSGSTLVLGYAGAGMVFLNLLYIIFFLPEPVHAVADKKKQTTLETFKIAIKSPTLVMMMIMLTILGLGFTNLESTFFLLLGSPHSVFHLTDKSARYVGAILLMLVGVNSAISQGLLTGLLTPRFGEIKIIRYCYPIMGIAILLVPFAPLWIPALLAVGLLSFSSGIANPNLNSLLSKAAPPEIQGSIFGMAQSLQAMARLTGPLISLPLFFFNNASPYILGSVLILIAAGFSWFIRLSEENKSVPEYVTA